MVESRLVIDRLINFEPININPDTLDNCPICGKELSEEEAKVCLLCFKCWNELIVNGCED